MRRILLLDPSICGYGGHYLEYALSVLRQADLQGFSCVLAVNRRYQPESIPAGQNRHDIQVLRVFKYTFWEIYGTCPYLRDFGSIETHSHTTIGRRMIRHLQQKKRIRQYQKDLEEFFAYIRLHPSDLLFVPTICHLELAVLADVLKKIQPVSVSVHLLFRRPLFLSADWEKEKHNPLVREIRAVLMQVRHMELQRMFFYTDTRQLAEQYNSLQTVSFAVLPIPHTKAPHKIRHYGRIVVGCLGGAREEKGFCILPWLIRQIKSDKMIYIIQSNTNETSGRMRHALRQLQQYPRQKVVLTSELSEKEYGRYLAAIDLMLLLYDPSAYQARSSGVFVEAVAAGCVVLVTAGTWMAEQVQMFFDRYGLRIGEICSGPAQAVRQLAKMERRMSQYQKDAAKAAEIYRSIHHPGKLLEKILEKELQG